MSSSTASDERRHDVNSMCSRAAERAIETHHAAGSGFGDSEIVLARDGVQSLRERSCLRGIAQRDVDIVSSQSTRRTAFRGLQLGANGDFRFVPVDLLCSTDYFAGDRAQFGFREVLFAAAYEEQKNKGAAGREN